MNYRQAWVVALVFVGLAGCFSGEPDLTKAEVARRLQGGWVASDGSHSLRLAFSGDRGTVTTDDGSANGVRIASPKKAEASLVFGEDGSGRAGEYWVVRFTSTDADVMSLQPSGAPVAVAYNRAGQ